MEGEGLKSLVKDAKKGIKKAIPAVATAVGGPVAGLATAFSLRAFQKRPPGALPPRVRTFLEKRGAEVITSIELHRSPLDAVSKAALAGVTLGQFDKAVKEAGYDAAFHLAMIVNGKYLIDKQEVIKVQQPSAKKKGGESQRVSSIPEGKTIKDMFEGAEKVLGSKRFTGYDARTNNCQDFILAMLQASAPPTPQHKRS